MKINSTSALSQKYLQILDTIAKPPKKLHWIGNIPTNRQTTVAIIGSRKPTAYGREIAYMLSHELAKRSIIVVSGLAYGIDTIAHRACLDAEGTTIAVLASGLSQIYPASNRQLADEIIKKGAIISEYEPSEPALQYRFLERNRIVSGISDAVIVIEATTRSGTFSTVMHALEQGKEVFAVPGNINSPLSQGCNQLIKQGAHPVTSIDDILEIISPDLLTKNVKLPLGSNNTETMILKILQTGVRDGEEVFEKLNGEIELCEYMQALTMMEIDGKIRALGGNQWVVK